MNNTSIPNQTTKWHVKLSTNDRDTFDMLKAVIEACKVPHFQFPTYINTFPIYSMVWDGEKMDDSISTTPPGVTLTVQQALQWLSAYVGAPKYIDIDSDAVLSGRCVRTLRVHKTGVKVLDLYGAKMGWIHEKEIVACADAIKELRKA